LAPELAAVMPVVAILSSLEMLLADPDNAAAFCDGYGDMIIHHALQQRIV
jgi:hypothetical protein